MSENEFKQRLVERLRTVDFRKVRGEIERFLVNREELKFLDSNLIEGLLRNYA